MNTLKHLNFLLVVAILFALSSCQTDVEHADSLRLENKFDEAAQLYQKAADEGDAYATWRLSIAYGNGDGVDFDQEKAFTLLKEAADKGCKEAECDLSWAYMFGWCGHTDSIKGKQMFDKLIAQDNDNAYIQSRYADLLLSGAEGLYEKNTEKALRILKQVKDKDDPYYLWVEGSIYVFGIDDIESDFSKAITYFTKSFEKGRRHSSVFLAKIYFTNNRKETFDIKKGIEWLKKGVESNSTDAMVLLAQVYLNISKDNEYFKSYQNPSKGIELLQKAINHGSGDAYDLLGMEFFNGINVNKDDKKFFEYSQKAYELRNGGGANNLGSCYQQGIGCERNINKAIEIYQEAVKLGSGLAAKNLFLIFRYGDSQNDIPVNFDRGKAKYYLLEGARLNDPIALLNLSFQYYPGGDMFETNYEQAYIYAKKSADSGNVDGCARVAFLLDNGIGCYKNPQEAQKYRDKYEVKKGNKQQKD